MEPNVNWRTAARICVEAIFEPGAVATVVHDLEATCMSHKLSFEQRPFPVSLVPLCVSLTDNERIKNAAETTCSALEVLLEEYLVNVEMQAFFAPYERYQLATCDPGYRPLIRLCRLDGLYDQAGRIKFVEPNSACPGSLTAMAVVKKLFYSSDWFTDLLQPTLVVRQAIDDPSLFGQMLLSAYRDAGGQQPNPSVALLNYNGLYMYELDMLKDLLTAAGIPAVIADARHLKIKGGQAYVGPHRVDIAYNKLDPLALLPGHDVDEYLSAITNGLLVPVNSGPSMLIAESKLSFALLTDEAWLCHRFDTSTIECLLTFLPWTRKVSPGITRYCGELVDLLDLIEHHRELFVIKPENSTRGHGVVIGHAVSQETWTQTVRLARANHWVVQEYVSMQQTWHATTARECLYLPTGYYGVDCFVVSGTPAGLVGRVSTEEVLNVGHKGAELPVFIIDE